MTLSSSPAHAVRLFAILSLLSLAALLAFSAAFAGDLEAGKAMYDLVCLPCHGETGKGDGPVGIALDPRPRDFKDAVFKFDTDGDGKTGTDADLANVITQGAFAFGGSPLMAPLPMSEMDVANVIAYVRTLH